MRLVYEGFELYVTCQIGRRRDLRRKYGQWAVISGATDGIGQAMAKELARRGHSIIVLGRSKEKLARTKELLEQQLGVGEVICIQIDLSDSSIENFERIEAEIDPGRRDVGILINNAGCVFSTMTRFYNLDMDTIKAQVDVNVLATLYLTRMILPGMVARERGLIINVSSLLGSITGPFIGTYSPGKNFIDSFSRQLQLEYADYPVDIVNIKPGYVHTNMVLKTSRFVKPSFMNPSADRYAKSTLNAVSAGYPFIAGYWFHGLQGIGLYLSELFGLLPYFYKLSMNYITKRTAFSPSPTRKLKHPVEGNQ